MKRIFGYILILISFVLISCADKGTGPDSFDIEIYTPDYAQGFVILGAEGMESTILRVINPWQGAEDVTFDVFIARDGEKTPKGFRGEVIDGDADRVVCMSSTYIAMLDAISEVERVVGVSGLGFVTNRYVCENGDKVKEVGYDANINFEVMVAQQTDLVLLYGVNGASMIEGKLRELGIPFVYVGEYMEEDPLGKSEWLVAIAELVGKRDKGVEVFSEIPRKYEQIKDEVSSFGLPKPKVMINTPYGENWFMAFTSSYMARLIADAGGDYVYKKNDSNRSLPIDMEEAALLIDEADVWINVDGVSTLNELKGRFPRFADAPCVKKGEIYKSDLKRAPGGGNDFWESGVIYPDKVLSDMAKIFYPREMEDVEFTYYRKLE